MNDNKHENYELLNLIGYGLAKFSIDFVKELPGREISNIGLYKDELEKYIKLYDRDFRLILVKNNDDEIDAIKWSGEITNKAFGIKLKTTRGILYMKSCWKWDQENNRILPINPTGIDNEIIPVHPSGDSRILLKQYKPYEK